MSLLKFALLEDFIRKWIGLIKIFIIYSLDYRKPCPRKSINFFTCDTYGFRRIPFFSRSLKYSKFPFSVESDTPYHLQNWNTSSQATFCKRDL